MSRLDGVAELKARAAQMEQAVDEGATAALKQLAERASHDAQSAAPVDTGALAASIRVVVNDQHDLAVIAGDGESYYAAYVEHGTSVSPAQPFMRPAAARAEADLERTMGQVLDKATG